MLRFTTLFILAMFNNNQGVTLFNNIKALEYIKDKTIYNHHYGNEFYIEWYKDI